MIEIYRKSIAYIVKNLAFLIAFAALIEGLIWVMKPRHESAATLVPLIFLAYLFHRYFLFGEDLTLRRTTQRDDVPPMKFGWFMLVSAGFVLVPVATAIAMLIPFVAGGSDKDTAVGLALLIGALAYLLALSLFGTVLPALVARDRSYRLSDGIRVTFQTMWRLLVGPGVVGLAGYVIAVLITRLQTSLGISPGSLAELGLLVLFRIMGFMTTILAVAVLCSMYRKVTPGPEAV